MFQAKHKGHAAQMTMDLKRSCGLVHGEEGEAQQEVRLVIQGIWDHTSI